LAYNKKAHYFSEAERLFVIESLTNEAIGERLHISSKTISDWRKEGDWDKKRIEYLRQKQSFHEELYDFSRVLLKKVKDDIEAGKDPSSGQLYTLTRLLVSMGKVKEYEDETVSKAQKSATSEDKKQEILDSIEDILGVK